MGPELPHLLRFGEAAVGRPTAEHHKLRILSLGQLRRVGDDPPTRRADAIRTGTIAAAAPQNDECEGLPVHAGDSMSCRSSELLGLQQTMDVVSKNMEAAAV